MTPSAGSPVLLAYRACPSRAAEAHHPRGGCNRAQARGREPVTRRPSAGASDDACMPVVCIWVPGRASGNPENAGGSVGR